MDYGDRPQQNAFTLPEPIEDALDRALTRERDERDDSTDASAS